MPVSIHNKQGAKTIRLDGDQKCNVAIPTGKIRGVLFTGIGQDAANIRIIAVHSSPHLAVVSALPYQRLRGDYATMTRFATNSVFAVLEALSPNQKPLDVFAESQAAPAVVLAALEQPKLFRSLTLIAPLGLNFAALGATPADRYRTLMVRSRMFWRMPGQSLRIKGNRLTARRILIDTLRNRSLFRQHMTFGANQNIEAELRHVAKQFPVTIYAGETDELFPYAEIDFTLTGSAARVVRLPGGHVNRATPHGLNQLADITDEIFSK